MFILEYKFARAPRAEQGTDHRKAVHHHPPFLQVGADDAFAQGYGILGFGTDAGASEYIQKKTEPWVQAGEPLRQYATFEALLPELDVHEDNLEREATKFRAALEALPFLHPDDAGAPRVVPEFLGRIRRKPGLGL